MSYSLKRREHVGANVRRIIEELVDDSVEHARSDGDVDERIHESRKNLKKVRAVLRLVRPRTDAYKRENARYRDTGRLLSDLRDTAARIETVDALRDRLTDTLDDDSFDALRAALVGARVAAFEAADLDNLFSEVLERLEEGRSVIDDIHVDADGFDAVRGGLAKTYDRARRLLAEAHADASVDVFHTWRKRVKYHRYHVDLLQPLWKDVLDEWEDALHDLTDDLGLAHDVAVLDEFLEDHEHAMGDPIVQQRVRSILYEASADARRDSLQRGRRAFAETSDALLERFRVYWEAWQHPPAG